MYEKPATIRAISSLIGESITIKVDGEKVLEGDSDIIVTGGTGCSDMLFFKNKFEFDEYVQSTGKKMRGYSLEEGLKFGVKIFRDRLNNFSI